MAAAGQGPQLGQMNAVPLQQQQLNAQLQQQLNLEDVRNRAQDLFNALDRIRRHLESQKNAKWQDVLSQFSVVNMSLVNIVEDIKKVSKAFVVYPKNVNQENSTKLPVMLSSKLLPEMELEETSRKEQILSAISNLPVPTQIDKLKSRIEAIAAACTCAEKCISEARKVYVLGMRHNPAIIPSLDKVQATKIDEQEKLLRAAVNSGEGLRLPVDQRQTPTVLPAHLELGAVSGDGETIFQEASGTLYPKNPPSSLSSIGVMNPGASQTVSSVQSMVRSAQSPITGTGGIPADNTAASPLQYANSPRSGPSLMNAPSPQQQQRAKVTHTLQQPQTYSSQQLRAQSSFANVQTHIPPSQEQQNQLQAKILQDRAAAYHTLQNRQFPSGSAQQHGIPQNTQGNQSKHHLAGAGNLANLYGQNQNFATSQMFNVPGGYQRGHSSQVFSETGYVGATGGPQNSMNLVSSQQHGGSSNFGTFSNSQLGQANLTGVTNMPLTATTNFSGLSNPPSTFSSISSLAQNTLHGQPNYGNPSNPSQNPNYGHQRQTPPQ